MTRGLSLTPREAADLLGRSVGFVRRLIADEQVRARRVRGRWYIDRGSVTEWVRGGCVEPRRPDRLSVTPRVVMGPGMRPVQVEHRDD